VAFPGTTPRLLTTGTLFAPLAPARKMRDGINPSLGVVRLKGCALLPPERQARFAAAEPSSQDNSKPVCHAPMPAPCGAARRIAGRAGFISWGME
jgi:hypothetical protein